MSQIRFSNSERSIGEHQGILLRSAIRVGGRHFIPYTEQILGSYY